MWKKLAGLSTRVADCIEDDHYIGIFVIGVWNETLGEKEKKRLGSWKDFHDAINNETILTIYLVNWVWKYYVIRVKIVPTHDGYYGSKKGVQIFNVEFIDGTHENDMGQLQINRYGYDPETNPNVRWDGILSMRVR